MIACFPVYRTYVRAGGTGVGAQDVAHVDEARGRGRARIARTSTRELFDVPGRPPAAAACAGDDGDASCVLRFQQVTGPGHGQGRRGHRLLLLQPARLAQRGRRRPRPLRRCRWPSSTPPARRRSGAGRAALLATSTHDTQAQRGRARAHPPAVGDARTRGRRRSSRWIERQRAPLGRARRPTATPSTSSTRRWSGRGPSSGRASRPTWRRRRARPRRARPGWRPNAAYEAALHGFVDGDARRRAASVADLAAFVAPLVGAGPRQLAGPGPAEADRARRARHLPGHASCGT